MALDLGLDRGGAGHRRLRSHQRGRCAQREAGDVPHRLKQCRPHPAPNHHRVEADAVELFLALPSARSRVRSARARPSPQVAPHRCASRHIRPPGRRAAWRRVRTRWRSTGGSQA
jgi:hypothetical protein